MSDVPAVLGVMTYGRAAARLGRASRAAVLSKEGASPRRILLETGYQRGPYGWGVETRGDVYLKPASVFGARPSGTLEEMADVHPDVERAYPGIGRELRVEVVPDNAWADRVAAARKSLALWASHGDTASGFYDRGNHLIAVRAQMPGETMNGYIDRADGTVTHEVQHYAQERDGLRPAGPRRHVDADDYREDGLEVDARNSAARRKLTPEERREMPRTMTQDVKPEDVRRDEKGGDNFGTFRNFLATDDVPETIFGIPVVQDESQYTEKDLEFFRKNPKAAGFYDLGDEEVDEDVPQQAAKSKPSRGAYPGSLNNPGNVEKRKERRQGEVDSPSERFAKFATPQDGLREMADAIRQIAEVKLAEKGLPFTVRNFAGVYAPSTEDDTAKYVADISADSGFGPDEELHRFDGGDMARLLKSVVRFESGAPHSAWFTDEEYAEAARKLQEGAVD